MYVYKSCFSQFFFTSLLLLTLLGSTNRLIHILYSDQLGTFSKSRKVARNGRKVKANIKIIIIILPGNETAIFLVTG